tara:strand:+ start:2829 stop:3332 length:504 start_codon:yes stop_codon:yes gene_type:complete
MKYNKSSNIIKGNSKIQAGETNDCSVRAFATALDVTYDAAHQFVKETYDRVDKKGCEKMVKRTNNLEGKVLEIENTKFSLSPLNKSLITNEYKLKGEVIERKKTVKSFLKDFGAGIYLVMVSGHVFTVKDGTMIDNAGEEWRPTRKVEDVFQVTFKNILEQLELNLV